MTSIDFSVNLMGSILWQHEGAQNLVSMAQNDQSWADINQRDFWDAWRRDVFDLTTANAFGLMVWSIILNSPLTIKQTGGDRENWGYGTFTGIRNFENAAFSYSFGGATVTLESARKLLRIRYFQLTMAPTVYNINYMLWTVFGPNSAYLIDRYTTVPMTMEYRFLIPVAPDLADIFTKFDVLPRPSGVLSTWSTTPRDAWGYETTNDNFERNSYSNRGR